MDHALDFLTAAALERMRETLAADPDYCQRRTEEEALWTQLRLRYPKEVHRAFLAVIDTQCGVLSLETERAFLTGLQLGISLGRLDPLERT